MYPQDFFYRVLLSGFSALILLTQFGCEIKTRDRLKTVDFVKPEPVKSQKKEGLVKNYRGNGQLLSEINYKEGKRHGLAKDYYPDGQLHNIINYQSGIKHGISKVFYENGKPYRVTPYDSGRINGVQIKYRDNGDKMAEIPYRYGMAGTDLIEYLLNGKTKNMYPKLKANSAIDYANDELVIEVYFDTKPSNKRVEYYLGRLEDGQFLHKNLTPILVKNNIGQIRFKIPSGQKIRDNVDLVGVWNTNLKNPYVVKVHHRIKVN